MQISSRITSEEFLSVRCIQTICAAMRLYNNLWCCYNMLRLSWCELWLSEESWGNTLVSVVDFQLWSYGPTEKSRRVRGRCGIYLISSWSNPNSKIYLSLTFPHCVVVDVVLPSYTFTDLFVLCSMETCFWEGRHNPKEMSIFIWCQNVHSVI